MRSQEFVTHHVWLLQPHHLAEGVFTASCCDWQEQHLTRTRLDCFGTCIFRSISLHGGNTQHSLQVPKQRELWWHRVHLRPHTTEHSQQLQETATNSPEALSRSLDSHVNMSSKELGRVYIIICIHYKTWTIHEYACPQCSIMHCNAQAACFYGNGHAHMAAYLLISPRTCWPRPAGKAYATPYRQQCFAR